MKYFKWILGGIAISFGIPMFLEFIIFRNDFPSALDNGEWASFLGSFLGGVVSLIGIYITIQFTQAENKKDRELMYKPYIRIAQCEQSKESVYIPIETDKTYIEDGKKCEVEIQLKNVGLGPLVEFKISDFIYVHSNGEKIPQGRCVESSFFEKDETLNLWFEFNLNIQDSNLEGINPKDTLKVIPFTNYGGDLEFKISGFDVCERPYAKKVKIHVHGQICEEDGKLKYKPEASLRFDAMSRI